MARVGYSITAEAKQWVEWVGRVDSRRNRNVDIAIRRTLQAVAERADPTDALVDAVTAWENLVGSPEGEPTLHLSTALAWLLGKNSTEREEIRQQVVKLYTPRSKIVELLEVL